MIMMGGGGTGVRVRGRGPRLLRLSQSPSDSDRAASAEAPAADRAAGRPGIQSFQLEKNQCQGTKFNETLTVYGLYKGL